MTDVPQQFRDYDPECDTPPPVVETGPINDGLNADCVDQTPYVDTNRDADTKDVAGEGGDDE